MDIPLLAVDHVSKRFGDLQAVSDLSFEVRSGEIFGFLGPNGAGKTTTLRMVLDITRPDSGAVRFEGHPGIVRARTGYLPEERGLFEDMPVLDTLVYLGSLRGMTVPDARAAGRRWLERVDLAARAGEKVNALSKGNQQKVQFGAALLHRPALAVLDEPFAGLDPLNQDLFLSLMKDACEQGTALLLSAHQLDLVERLADRFLLIARGRALLHGTLAEIRRAASGGRDEALVLELAARDGIAPTPETLAPLLAGAASGAEWTARALEDGLTRLDVLMPGGAALDPVLVSLGARFEIRRVESRRIPLHDLYLRAVRADQDADRAEAARA